MISHVPIHIKQTPPNSHFCIKATPFHKNTKMLFTLFNVSDFYLMVCVCLCVTVLWVKHVCWSATPPTPSLESTSPLCESSPQELSHKALTQGFHTLAHTYDSHTGLSHWVPMHGSHTRPSHCALTHGSQTADSHRTFPLDSHILLSYRALSHCFTLHAQATDLTSTFN